MTKPRTYACIYVFFYNIELAYKGRQITKSKSHVSCIHYIFIRGWWWWWWGGWGYHCCVKEYIEMPTRFHSQLMPHKSMWLQRLLTLKGKRHARPAVMHQRFHPPSFKRCHIAYQNQIFPKMNGNKCEKESNYSNSTVPVMKFRVKEVKRQNKRTSGLFFTILQLQLVR